MKTKEQIINWLKSKEWYKEFCEKTGLDNYIDLHNYVESMMRRQKYLMSAAFLLQDPEKGFWQQWEDEYLKWLNSEDEKPEEAKESKTEDRFIFDRGSREAPFYMVYVEGESSPTYKHCTMESATKEADRLAKSLNKKSFVLAAVMEIRLEVITSAISIENMEKEKEDDCPF